MSSHDGIEDMIKLTVLTDQTLLENLKVRYSGANIYVHSFLLTPDLHWHDLSIH